MATEEGPGVPEEGPGTPECLEVLDVGPEEHLLLDLLVDCHGVQFAIAPLQAEVGAELVGQPENIPVTPPLVVVAVLLVGVPTAHCEA